MQDSVKRSPALQPDEAGEVAPHHSQADRREHHDQGDGKGAVIQSLEYDFEDWHPLFRLKAGGLVNGFRLQIGTRPHVAIKRGGVAQFFRPALGGAVKGVDQHLLLHDFARVTGCADQIIMGDGQA